MVLFLLLESLSLQLKFPIEKHFSRWLNDISVHKLLCLVLAGFLIGSIATMIWLVLSSNQSSANRLVSNIGTFAEATVQSELMQLQREADAQLSRVQGAIEAGWISPRSVNDLHDYFLSERNAGFHPAISDLFLGTPDGNLYGLQADSAQWPETNWRFTLVSSRTSRRLVQYDIQANGKRGGVLRRLGRYDTQSNGWYQDAVAMRDGSVWSTADLLGASRDNDVLYRSRAIVDVDGQLIAVAGVQFEMRHLQSILHGIPLSDNTLAAVVENDSLLLAARESGSIPRAQASARASNAVGQNLINFWAENRDAELTDPAFVESGRALIEYGGESGRLMAMQVGEAVGLDWKLVLFVPCRDYLGSYGARLSRLFPLILVALGLALCAVMLFLRFFSKPLVNLRDAAARIAVGQFDVPLQSQGENEIGQLSRAVDGMRFRLRDSFNELLKQTRRAEVTLDSIADGVISVTADGCVRYMNVQAETLTGQSFRSVRGMPVEQVFKARDERTGEPMTRRAILRGVGESPPVGKQVVVSDTNGERHFVHCRVSPIRSDSGTMTEGAVLIFSDLSKELKLRTELVHQASHDTLTDLVNRREFERRVLRAIESTGSQRGETHVLCYIDVDQFKVINDSCGHIAGDELLRQLARHFEQKLRAGDTVSRLGGDEFGILLEQCSLTEAQRVIGAMRDSIAEFRFFWDDRSFSIGLSAGMVVLDQDTVSVMAALRDGLIASRWLWRKINSNCMDSPLCQVHRVWLPRGTSKFCCV